MKNWRNIIAIGLVLLMTIGVLSGCQEGGPAPSGPPATQAGGDASGNPPSAPAVSTPAEGTTGEKIKLRYSTVSPNFDSPPFSKSSQDFVDAIETGILSDRLEVEMYWGGSLGTSVEAMFGGLQNGSFELCSLNETLFAEYTNAWMPLDIPYIINSVEHTKAVLTGEPERVMNEKGTVDSGIRVILHQYMGFRHVTNSKRPITKLEDFQNLKIRLMSNELQIAAFQALGSSCIAVAYAELYTALQQKMVDAQENPISNDVDKKFYEVQKYFTYTYHLPALSCVGIGEQVFQSFDDQLKADVLEVAKQATLSSFDYTLKAEEEQAAILGQYMEMNELDPAEAQRIREAAAAATDKYKEIIGAEYYDQVVPLILELAK